MIVDDEPFNVEVIKGLLGKIFNIDSRLFQSVASDGLEAIDFIKKDLSQSGDCSYKLILMDSQMPQMDGYEAAKEIRKITEDVQRPTIFSISGHTEPLFI